MIVGEFLRKTMLMIGAISSGESLSATEASDGLASLSDLIDSWSTEGLLVPTVSIEEFTLIPGQSSYSIGPTGNFATSVPQEIIEARLKDVTGTAFEIPMKVLSTQEWADITQKTVRSSQPDSLYFQRIPTSSYIYFYPTPSVANKVVLYQKKVLNTVYSVNDVVNFTPGYLRALRYNLAVELAIEYGKQPRPEIIATAQELKAQLKRVNQEPLLLKNDILGVAQDNLKPFNIYTGS